MSKMKYLLMDILEQYGDGRNISQISDDTGLPMDVVFNILQQYGAMVDDTTIATLQ
jgi:hypothetical protein